MAVVGSRVLTVFDLDDQLASLTCNARVTIFQAILPGEQSGIVIVSPEGELLAFIPADVVPLTTAPYEREGRA